MASSPCERRHGHSPGPVPVPVQRCGTTSANGPTAKDASSKAWHSRHSMAAGAGARWEMREREGGTRRRQISLATWSSTCRASPEESRACASYTPDLAEACAVQDLSRCAARGGCPSAARTSAYSAAACFAILRCPSSAEASTSLHRQVRIEGCRPQQARTAEQIHGAQERACHPHLARMAGDFWSCTAFSKKHSCACSKSRASVVFC